MTCIREMKSRLVGLLSRMQKPANPGEFDQARLLAESACAGQVPGTKKPRRRRLALERRLDDHHGTGWLAAVRGFGQRALGDAICRARWAVWPRPSSSARARPLASAGWDKFVRTGVIHILVVAGHHPSRPWHRPRLDPARLGLRLCGTQRRLSGSLLVTYALLTGGHPPGLRAALTMGAICLGLVMRRRTLHANVLALAWLLVAILLPGDIFGAGCQLSFLSVIVLHWGCRRDPTPEPDPLDLLIERSRPWLVRAAEGLLFAIYEMYRVTFLVWLAVTPLTAAHTHLVPFAGLRVASAIDDPGHGWRCSLASGFLIVHVFAPRPWQSS